MTSIPKTLGFIARHPLSSKRPVSAFLRYARWQIESRIRRDVEFNWVDGSKLVVRNGMTGATGNIYCGLHEFHEMAFLLHLLRPNDLFVDVGANIGSYTVLASAVCGAHSLSAEPDPDAVRAFRQNIERNGIVDRVTLIEAALGAAPGKARFTIGRDTENRIANEGEAGARAIQVTTLDQCLNGADPVLIKMDVEGYEARVIAGAGASLRNSSLLAIQMESAEDDVVALLKHVGFEQSIYDPFTRRLSVALEEPLGLNSHTPIFVRNLDSVRQRLQTAPLRNIVGHLI